MAEGCQLAFCIRAWHDAVSWAHLIGRTANPRPLSFSQRGVPGQNLPARGLKDIEDIDPKPPWRRGPGAKSANGRQPLLHSKQAGPQVNGAGGPEVLHGLPAQHNPEGGALSAHDPSSHRLRVWPSRLQPQAFIICLYQKVYIVVNPILH